MTDAVAGHPQAVGLLQRSATAVPGLYRTQAGHDLSTVAKTIVNAYHGDGPVRLGRTGRLAVIAVDGLGFSHAAAMLNPDLLTPLTSEFPTTTVACMLTSLTGRPAGEHGFIGVQYLHPDGRRTVNCHDGHLDVPTSEVPPRPTITPAFATVFSVLAGEGVPAVAVPNELGRLGPAVRDRLLLGCSVTEPELPPTTEPGDLVEAFGTQLDRVIATTRTGLIWSYLDLDSYVHRRGMDDSVRAAVHAIDQLARRVSRGGTAVLLFSDHGLTENRPSPDMLHAWQEASGPQRCRLPAGGAGRTRWLYPHAGEQERLSGWLTERVPDAVVTSPDQLAAWGLVEPGCVGQRRLGEIVLLARGPDFPGPDPTTGYEHGSMTAEEVLVPMAIWQPDR